MSLEKSLYDINDWRPAARALLKVIREAEGSEEHVIDDLAIELKKMFDVHYDDFLSTDMGEHVTRSRLDTRDHVLGVAEGFKADIDCIVEEFNQSLHEAAERAIAEMASRIRTETKKNETEERRPSRETSEGSGGPDAAS